MEKEALLNIILKDLGEIETMVKTFQGQQDIPAAFLELTESKLSHVAEEFKLLKTINGETIPVATQVIKEEVKAETPAVTVPPVVEEKIESPVEKIVIEESLKLNNIEETTPEKISEPELIQTSEATQETIVTPTTPEPKPEVIQPSPIVEQKQEEVAKTLGESFVGEKKSVNDIIANAQESSSKKVLKGKPVSDLTKGLGINDRFMFQRELFDGKPEMMSQTLQQLNDMPDFDSAHSFIKSNFNWDVELEATKAFFNYIERKF